MFSMLTIDQIESMKVEYGIDSYIADIYIVPGDAMRRREEFELELLAAVRRIVDPPIVKFMQSEIVVPREVPRPKFRGRPPRENQKRKRSSEMLTGILNKFVDSACEKANVPQMGKIDRRHYVKKLRHVIEEVTWRYMSHRDN